MDDTIYRQAAIDAVRHSPIIEVQPAYMLIDKADVLKNLVMIPSAQRTGRWIWDDEGYHCTECFYHAYNATGEIMTGEYKFCPNCGCAMEGEE